MKSTIRRRGFTLIELLVVLVIIALLAAILFPVFAQAKRAAKRTTSISHMNQIGKGVMLYLGDYDDIYPMTMETVSTGFPTTVSWWAVSSYQKALEPYLRQTRGGTEEGRINGRDSVWFDPEDPDRAIPYMWGSYTDNGFITGTLRSQTSIARVSSTVYATLREKQWHRVLGMELPTTMPTVDDPFWSSEYFDMCLDPWELDNEPDHPFHWERGLALPPCSLFPDFPDCGGWDLQIDGRSPELGAGNRPRYGRGQTYLFADGHAKFLAFEATYRSVEANMWSVNELH